MIILDCEQGSDEWFLARCGVATASNFDKIITSQGKASTQAKGYMNKLVAEFYTKEKDSIKSNEWMERGIELETEARQYYEFLNDCEVDECGLIFKDEKMLIGCSPDGLIAEKGRGLEIKCPAPHTHVEYLLNGKIPSKYIQQVQGSMWVSGLKEWDFMSYHPQMPKLIITVKKDDDFHKNMDIIMDSFINKMMETREKLNQLTIK